MTFNKSCIIILHLTLLPFAVVSCTNYQEEEIPSSFSVEAKELLFPEDGGKSSLSVSSGSKWDVTSMPGWISLGTINQLGVSPYEWSLDFSASANDEFNRDGAIVFRSQTETKEIPVTQEGKKGRYVPIESISIFPVELLMTVGEDSLLSYTINPLDASVKDVSWKSIEPSIATVSQSGRVDAVSEGTTVVYITTEDGGKTASCTVTVRPVSVSSVTLDKESLVSKIGETSILTAKVLPENAADKTVSWSSSNVSVATVDQYGKVTAKATGLATITVTTNDGAKIANCLIYIINNSDVEWVDLGLSVKWATCNLGAFEPEEYGDYYAWGEIEAKDEYWWSNYKWCNGSSESFTKYNFLNSYGTVDNKTVLELDDDAAHVQLGVKWRMPTIDEWTELRENCIWTLSTLKDVAGELVTSKKNEASIFFPIAGYKSGNATCWPDGLYWSSSLYAGSPVVAMFMRLERWGAYGVYRQYYPRAEGLSIRPVTE